jgi:hypothetical protein
VEGYRNKWEKMQRMPQESGCRKKEAVTGGDYGIKGMFVKMGDN